MEAKDMLVSAGEEELKKIIPESAKDLYNVLKEVYSSVDIEKQKLLEEAKVKLIEEAEGTEWGQKVKSVTNQLEDTAKEVKNEINVYKEEVNNKINEHFEQTKEVETTSTRKITNNAEAKLVSKVELKEVSASDRWPFLSEEMKVLVMGFEEELKVKALKEVADMVSGLDMEKNYSGYAIKVSFADQSVAIGASNSTLHFLFNKTTAEVKYFISGTGVIDLDGVMKFSTYSRDGDSISMSSVDQEIGNVTINGIILGDTLTGTISFTIEGFPTTMTFRASKVQ